MMMLRFGWISWRFVSGKRHGGYAGNTQCVSDGRKDWIFAAKLLPALHAYHVGIKHLSLLVSCEL